ncbi:hypothetical protein N9F50_00185 [Akkermansiaceae bacterium]|nr:hypothetical protein [Akkermansiaceae bacterium]
MEATGNWLSSGDHIELGLNIRYLNSTAPNPKLITALRLQEQFETRKLEMNREAVEKIRAELLPDE